MPTNCVSLKTQTAESLSKTSPKTGPARTSPSAFLFLPMQLSKNTALKAPTHPTNRQTIPPDFRQARTPIADRDARGRNQQPLRGAAALVDERGYRGDPIGVSTGPSRNFSGFAFRQEIRGFASDPRHAGRERDARRSIFSHRRDGDEGQHCPRTAGRRWCARGPTFGAPAL